MEKLVENRKYLEREFIPIIISNIRGDIFDDNNEKSTKAHCEMTSESLLCILSQLPRKSSTWH